MLVAIYFHSLVLFTVFYVIALITDILDGFIARKQRTSSNFGKKLDILADNFILCCVIIGLYFFQKQTIMKFALYFIGIFVYYLIVQLISLTKTKKLIFMRTFIANFTAIAFPFIVFYILFFKSRTAVLVYSILMIFSLTEKLFLQIYDKKQTIISLPIKKIFLFLIIFLIVSSVFILYKPKSELCFNEKCIEIEIMQSPEERALGLMYRQKISEDQGMLFIFDQPLKVNFWMKNVQFSIDMIFIDETNTIVHIEKNVPPCHKDPCPTYSSISEVKYVVEVVSGFCDKFNVKTNQTIEVIY